MSDDNIMKLLANRRTGNINPNSTQTKGDKFQELTCRWRSIISTVPVEDLNKKLDNYNSPIDHSIDSVLGIIQTKGRFYDSYNQCWTQNFTHEHNAVAKGFDFDVLILYCVSKDGKIIERIYIFPSEEILKRISITVYDDPKDRWKNSILPWYEEYRIDDEKVLLKVNEIWKHLTGE